MENIDEKIRIEFETWAYSEGWHNLKRHYLFNEFYSNPSLNTLFDGYRGAINSKILEGYKLLPTKITPEMIMSGAEPIINWVNADRKYHKDGMNIGSAYALVCLIYESILSGFVSKPEANKNEWISVDDRLPEFLEMREYSSLVLICDEDGNVDISRFNDNSYCNIENKWTGYGTRVRYWRPLPNPPVNDN